MLEATLKLWHVVFWQGFDCSCASRWLGHPWFSVSLLVYVHLETLIGRRPGWWVGDFSTAHQIKTRLINSWNLKNHLIEKENHLIKKIIINSCLVTHHLPSKQSDGLGCVGTWGRIPWRPLAKIMPSFWPVSCCRDRCWWGTHRRWTIGTTRIWMPSMNLIDLSLRDALRRRGVGTVGWMTGELPIRWKYLKKAPSKLATF